MAFHPYPYDHVVSRWALVRSIVDDGTMKIDAYSGLTSDRSEWEGHAYSDKSALLSFACVPPAALMKAAGVGSGGSIPLPDSTRPDTSARGCWLPVCSRCCCYC